VTIEEGKYKEGKKRARERKEERPKIRERRAGK
jgi:hypothetical protein